MVYRQPAPLRCIECKTELTPAGVGDYRFHNCPKCGSAWVTRLTLDAMVDEMKQGNHLNLVLMPNTRGPSIGKDSPGLSFRISRKCIGGVTKEVAVENVHVANSIIKIGRLSSSHVKLDDESVSRMHAVIEITAARTQLVDLGSTSGTTVNGKRKNKHDLSVGDVIEIGVFELLIQSSADHRQRQCPQCKSEMVLMMFADVEIDSCHEHGVWFDVTELERFLLLTTR